MLDRESTITRIKMLSVSVDASLLIQTNLRYYFVNEELLHSALRSAHREKGDNDVLDDGNRGLAYYGNLAMQMAMAHEVIIDKGKTLRTWTTSSQRKC